MKEENFEVNGSFFDGTVEKIFSMKVTALNESLAKEIVYCLLGSKHKCKRRHIKINAVNKISEKDA